MSTRSTISYGETFHLFTELMDEEMEAVYLELEGPDVDFSASPGSVTVRIPLPVWERIRQHKAYSFDNAHLTDDEIRERVEQHVKEGLGYLEEGKKAENKRMEALAVLQLFDAEPTWEAQMAAGILIWTERRAKELAVLKKIADLK